MFGNTAGERETQDNRDTYNGKKNTFLLFPPLSPVQNVYIFLLETG